MKKTLFLLSGLIAALLLIVTGCKQNTTKANTTVSKTTVQTTTTESKTTVEQETTVETTNTTSIETTTTTEITTKASYTIEFKNDSITLETLTIEEGELPVYSGDTPTKDSTEKYTFTFTGWDKEIVPASENAVYNAVFGQTLNTYQISFTNEDGTVLQSSLAFYGSLPTYNGDTPVKASTDEYTYTFKSWDHEIETVTKNETYKAVFEEEKIDYSLAKNWFTSPVTCVAVEGSNSSFDFTTDDSTKVVVEFKPYALNYLKNNGYTHIRITYYGKGGKAMNLGLSKDNAFDASVWTNNAGAKQLDLEINESLSVIKSCYAVQDGIDGFNLVIEAVDYTSPLNWFTPDVDFVKKDGTTNDFYVTTDDSTKAILYFNQTALSWLKSKGYTHIRITYYGKDGKAMNLGLSKNNVFDSSVWTNSEGKKTIDFEINDELSVIKSCYAAQEGIDGFEIVIEAVTVESE